MAWNVLHNETLILAVSLGEWPLGSTKHCCTVKTVALLGQCNLGLLSHLCWVGVPGLCTALPTHPKQTPHHVPPACERVNGALAIPLSVLL